METEKDPKRQSILKEKNGAGGINFLTSDYTKATQSPVRQYSTGTKERQEFNGTRWNVIDK